MTTQKTTTSFHDRIPPSPIGHYPEPIYMPTWWDWITGRGDPILATSRLTVVLSILVIVSAGILGFTALHDLFISIDLFHPVLGYLFPILFDAAEVSFAISTLNAQLQGEENRFSWRMVITFTLLGISANIAHATFAGLSGVISQEQAILAVIFTSLFPLSIALVTHNLKNVIKLRIKRSTLLKTTEHLIHEIQQLQIQQQSLLRHQTQIEQQRAELNQQMDCDRQQGEAELADLIRQKEQLQQEIKSLKNERWAAKRGTDLVNDGIDAEPNQIGRAHV